MKIDRRITNGLAWAGVVLVVGIPAADLLSAQFLGDTRERAPQVAVIAPMAPMPAPLSQRPAAPTTDVKVAAPQVVAPVVKVVEPAKPATPSAAQTATAVDTFLQSGRPLPSYITEAGQPAPTQVAATPPARQPIATDTDEPVETDPVQVASIPAPTKVAPMPMPLSMRPMPAVPTMAGQTAAFPMVNVPVVAVAEPVVIIPDVIIPDVVVAPIPPADITAADLEDWESGPLSEFLAARQQQGGNDEAYYDPDGFFLDDGPNQPRPPRDRYIGPDNGQTFFFPFSN